ncbi:MAG: hypothetical protein CMN55_08645 [Sneathiella sp.]|jgi:hypothetical protein|uniref:hypothetical protein n=1 Tax=Sneathiella sp. TaxID=1964365 RepID=UPI000C481512|nr:hypothetical protein [Sneathiella sp.]MAL79163.1 hypothetical protein [Sneathiella sp.]
MRFRLFFRLVPALLCLFFFLPSISAATQQRSASPAAFLSRPDVFPVGIWLQDPVNAAAFKSIGVNFYAGLWKGPTERQLRQLQKAEMAVFSPQNEEGLKATYNDIIAGWIMPDEPDNAQMQEGGGFGPPVPPEQVIRLYEQMKARDSSRPILLNLGQGVAWDGWYGRGTRSNHPEDYETYVKAGDILSFDIYPVTHRDSGVRGRLDYVARGVDRLLKWSGGTKPVWSVIEASRVSNAERMPDGEDVRRLVWLSIIHGARGIIYFVHQFSPRFVEASLLENDRLRQDITRINTRLQSLATVLNSDALPELVTVEPDAMTLPGSIVAISRRDECDLYIFAGSISRFPTAARFRLSEPVPADRADVLDEGRDVRLEKGQFKDEFGPYAVHLYKIPHGGANCPQTGK